ncbi:protein SODIUM POTASSIUM ROOT DEFECTIVE 3-like [Oryza glaberrima]|uniref:HMA domain-containing protein n=4 Tax=Oryza TaxID=4527 RepID=A0A0D3EZC0_9ORYZ|nr:protein SODIUM POTASSIUM ROOT DEFECTIVE 3-like [Oryza glaberrima]
MASVVLKDLNKRLLGLSCSSAASTSIVLSGHSPPHLRDPARTSNSSKKKKAKANKSKQQLVSPASSSRFLLNSSRMQPSADELPPPFVIPVAVAAAAEENEIVAAAVEGGGGEEEKRESSSQVEVVVLRVSLHCKGCAGKVKKHISKMEGVTSLDIDIATKKVTVVGHVTPLSVLTAVSKIKPAQFWPISSSSSPMPPRASASF